uniref:Putative conserved secreted protein n=1 Tax=Phlebotomus kandelakii TaxID=1109342 RepID=A0A6B2EAX6_9DIPT
MQWLRAVVLLAVFLLEASEARPKAADADLATSDRSVEGIHVEESTEYDVKKSSLADSIMQVTDQLITTPRDVTNASLVNSTLVLEDAPRDEAKANEEIFVGEEEGHRGVAVPLTMKDLEREMAAMDIRLKESSTPKVGISTWILLSESGSTVSPDLKGPTYEIGTESKATTETINTIPKKTDVVSKEVNVETPKVINGKAPVKNNPQRKKQTTKESETTEKVTKSKKRTTTRAPAEATTEASSKEEPTTRQTPAAESTTFLILEPKDADFDLPQDRSPSLHKKTKVTTKAPNKPQQKKKPNNKNKKKPQDEASSKPANKPGQKDKPISTKIYNYLSREVMPTVGVSLVGLVVTAGIASYLLGGPFGALRRSYDVDRKDDVYFNNNEEYAGPDGQFEEEWLSKVMAGSPSYRNSIRYHSYRPVQAPNQAPNQAYQAYAAYKYPQYSRYRTTGHHLMPQYNPQPVHHQPAPNYQAYKTYSPVQAVPQMDMRNTQKSISGSVSYVPNEMPTKTHMSPVAGEMVSELKASQSITVGSGSDAPAEKDNILQHRSQFVVGSVINDQPEDQDTMPVPEHGPRRRRNAPDDRNSRGINDNEVDGLDDDTNEVEGSKDPVTNPNSPEITDSTFPAEVTSTTENVDVIPVEDTSFFDLIRRLVDLKIRFGLSFLQNATSTFQRYLQGVQERIDHSPTYTY